MILMGGAVGGKSLLMGSVQAAASGRPKRWSAAVVLIVWRDIPEALMEPDRVIEDPAVAQFGLELPGVGDLV